MALVRRVAKPLSVGLACADFSIESRTPVWLLWENRHTGPPRAGGLPEPPFPLLMNERKSQPPTLVIIYFRRETIWRSDPMALGDCDNPLCN
jgi:hypothetical protein